VTTTDPARLEADLVVTLRAAGCVFAEQEAALLVAGASSESVLDAMVARRVAGEPLEVILGWVEFCGLRIVVEPGVFVPRQRSRLLVAESARLAAPGQVVVDLCCGTGALALALLDRVPGIEVHAADVEPAAVHCARRNLAGRGQVHAGDLWSALPERLRGRIDVLVCNAPYVPTDAIGLMPPEARDHEPRVALDGGADGLDVHRRVAAGALGWLAPGGHLLVEAGKRQLAECLAVFTAAGLTTRAVSSDELDARVVVATRAGYSAGIQTRMAP
jgi:release factor glutamine methyltransferase